MTIPEPTGFPLRWEDLPDPNDDRAPDGDRCCVGLPWDRFDHLVGKHVVRVEEPWGDLLRREVVEALRSLGTEGRARGEADTLESFRDDLDRELARSLRQPRVVLFRSRFANQPAGSWQEAWEVVLPSGALLIVRRKQGGYVVSTCYFRQDVCRIFRARRWRELCAKLVRAYCARGGRNLLHPGPERERRVEHEDGEPEWRSHIRFVTLEQWGFDPEWAGTPQRNLYPPWRDEGPPGEVRVGLDPRYPVA